MKTTTTALSAIPGEVAKEVRQGRPICGGRKYGFVDIAANFK